MPALPVFMPVVGTVGIVVVVVVVGVVGVVGIVGMVGMAGVVLGRPAAPFVPAGTMLVGSLPSGFCGVSAGAPAVALACAPAVFASGTRHAAPSGGAPAVPLA
jgi:hypothetical protein